MAMLDESGFVVAKQQRVGRKFKRLDRPLRTIEFLSDVELACIPTGEAFVFDSEVYPNFFYVAFKHIRSGKYVAFERSPEMDFDPAKLRWMLWRFLVVGFNSIKFDMPIIQWAMMGATTEQLHSMANFIIREEAWPFRVEKEYKIKLFDYNHIDLIEVAPLQGSLKLYTGRIHCKRMQDLPIEPGTVLTQEEASIIRPYCCNDLDNTELLYTELFPQIDLRTQLGKEYQIDLRSKSDAQLAEAVINKELQKLTGFWPRKLQSNEVPDSFKYDVPNWVQFESDELNRALTQISKATFHLDAMGSPMWPAGLGELEKSKTGGESWVLRVNINGTIYKMGMGGLHSQESNVAHIAGPDEIIADNDVESFYPRIIINERLYPPHLGEAFLTVYEGIVNRRLDAKRTGNKVVSDSLKITINGSFGKLGNRYSTLYAPKLLLQVTLTGQLALLMLICMLSAAGIQVIQANTDGIVLKYPRSMHATVRAVIEAWEARTNFKTEETRYAGLYSRDVNNYLATKLKQDKKTGEWLPEVEACKTKGVYSELGSALNSRLSKNPETLICSDAVQALLMKGTPIVQTIRQCKDLRRFVAVKNVKGGGEKGGYYLGKVVRWYYARNEPGFIAYTGSGNKVAKSDNAKPVMDLPDEFPIDINYDWYMHEATKMLYDCGYLRRARTLELF